MIEIKSTQNVTKEDVTSLIQIQKDVFNLEAFCFSNDPAERLIEGREMCALEAWSF